MPTSKSGRDPLDLLGDLPYWPGATPPKSKTNSKRSSDSELNGARSSVYRINGEDLEMFSVGELARALERKPVTIRMWESQGWIPKANYRTPTPRGEQVPGKAVKGRRLYSKEQILLLVRAVALFSLDKRSAPNSPKWEQFRSYVKEHWPK